MTDAALFALAATCFALATATLAWTVHTARRQVRG